MVMDPVKIREQSARLGIPYPEDRAVAELRSLGLEIDSRVPDVAWYIQRLPLIEKIAAGAGYSVPTCDDGMTFVWREGMVFRSAQQLRTFLSLSTMCKDAFDFELIRRMLGILKSTLPLTGDKRSCLWEFI